MTTNAIRKKVHQYIDDVDDTVIKAVYAMLKEFNKSDKNNFKPLSIEEYNTELDKAEEEINSGNFLTHKQAITEINKW